MHIDDPTICVGEEQGRSVRSPGGVIAEGNLLLRFEIRRVAGASYQLLSNNHFACDSLLESSVIRAARPAAAISPKKTATSFGGQPTLAPSE
jgi:hypothetical protein